MTERRGTRVLCFAPYNVWTLHGLWEGTVLQGARLRGADVALVHCDGLMSDCDLYWAATVPRDAAACRRCQAHCAQLSNQLGLDFEWLSRYTTPEEIQSARDWADALPAQALMSACRETGRAADTWPLGEWVRSSVHSDRRDADLDLDDPEVERVYRSYVRSAAILAPALARLLDHHRPDVLFTISGRLAPTRVALELARARGIRVICHERGTRDETLLLYENHHCHAIEPIRQMWRDWGDVPLSETELETISAYFDERAQGRNSGWHSFSSIRQTAAELRQSLGLREGHRLFAIFTGSDDEVIASPDWASPFGRQRAWLAETLAWAKRHPEVDLALRIHPNTAGAVANGTNRRQVDELRALDLPPNVHRIEPDATVDSYALMDAADVGLVFNSTVAWEMAARRKPVVLAAGSLASGLPFVDTVQDVADYPRMLDRLCTPLDNTEALERARLAHRFAYGFYFRYTTPLPLVAMPDAHHGELRYDTLDALQPGRCEALDRIVEILIDGNPVCAGPEAAARARTDAAERVFFGMPPATHGAQPASPRATRPRVDVLLGA